MVLWIIGLSGAGKTTVGRAVHDQWRQAEPNTVFVDGDEVRALFSQVPHPDPYSIEGRRANAHRMTELCAWLDRQGINVVCCILSIFDDMRRDNRTKFSNYFEVDVRAPLEVRARRDRKNIYGPALAGDRKNVVGIDIPYEEPTTSDFILDNSKSGVDPSELGRSVLEQIARRHSTIKFADRAAESVFMTS